MHRRGFLRSCLATLGLGAAAACRPTREATSALSVMTVNGPIPSTQMGLTLSHEHVLVDFIGADRVSPERYDREEVVAAARPHLEALHDLGGRTLVESTPAFLGRDPFVLQRLARSTGLHLLTNTGLYGAREDQHLPPYAFEETADQLAARWTAEWKEGIGPSGVRPGFIKVGVDPGTLTEVDRKLVRAGARTHLQTGLTLAVHTGPAQGAFEQLDVLAEEGVDASAWIWVHAQGAEDPAAHVEAVRRGAWVELDGIGPGSAARHLDLVQNLKTHGQLGRVLLSQDAGWYHVGEPDGGTFRPYSFLLTDFVPMLQEAGFTDAEVRRLLVDNPADAFAVRVRAR